jgi:Ca2+-binding RTX toxin-like protein
VIDTSSPVGGKVETLSSKFLEGFLPNPNTFEYNTFETISVSLSNTANILTILSTPLGSTTYIYGGAEADLFTVNATKGNLTIDGGEGNDVFSVWSLYEGTTTVFKGGFGNDTLNVDGRVSGGQGSTIDNTVIAWSGGGGDDTLKTYFVSNGTTTLNIFDDEQGINRIQLDCADFACYVLSRDNFLANIHAPGDNSSTVERINLEATANIANILIRLNGGLNQMYFDDTMAKMDGEL